jgi:hypothetical protein
MADQKGDLMLLGRKQIGPASEMLTQAFFNDSKLTHVLPDEEIRKERGRHLFSFELRYGMNYGRVYTTSPALEGVAVWLPSERFEITFWRGGSSSSPCSTLWIRGECPAT